MSYLINDPVMGMNRVFAKVSGNEIVEYPVYENHIVARSEPLDIYTLCVFDVKPNLGPYEYAKEVPELVDGIVKVHYVVESLTLQQILSKLVVGSPVLGMQTTPVNIADLSPEEVSRIIELVTEYVQNKLDAFAQEKQYDNMLSLVSYSVSSNTTFSAEATHGMDLRDQTWGALAIYLNDVQNGIVPVPNKIEEIDTNLPALTWV